MYNVLEYLEHSARCFPEKIAVVDEHSSIRYAKLLERSQKIGSALAGKINRAQPVVIYMEKGIDALCAFFGVAFAGGCYCLINTELPKQRAADICAVLKAETVITSRELMPTAKDFFKNLDICAIDELAEAEVDLDALSAIRRSLIDTDPLYINFTSGSTGVPKGIVVCHRSVIDFIGQFAETFGITADDVIANQAPFDFDVSVKDIYSAMKTGATLLIVPRRMFSAPTQLIDFLCDNRATVMIWAVSALCLISTFHGLDYRVPTSVKKILFSGEVMPHKHLCTWREHLPEAMFVNLYGPTEITCNCTYHILQADRDYSHGIPIGKAFANEDVFLLDGDDKRITEAGKAGEICVRGTTLALGYYCAPEQTAQHFTQNPLNPHYPELIYRTGDLGAYNENGELVFSGRKDFQIKYMGHRIELEEIERAMAAIDGVERCCCIFDEQKSKLKGYYVGAIDKKALHLIMRDSLPIYMIPSAIRQVEQMPLTKNGKIDRKKLEEMGAKR